MNCESGMQDSNKHHPAIVRQKKKPSDQHPTTDKATRKPQFVKRIPTRDND